MMAVKPVSVRTLLEMGVLGDAKILCGSQGLDHGVTHVTIIGAPQIEPWIRENELIMTTGYHYKDDPGGIVDMIRALVDRNVAAFVFKEGLYLPNHLTPDSIKTADQAGLPVIRVHQDIAWADIIESIYVLLLRGASETGSRSLLVARLRESPAVAFYRKVLSSGYEAAPENDRGEADASSLVKERDSYSLFAVRIKKEESVRAVVDTLQASLIQRSRHAVAFELGDSVAVIWPCDGPPLTQEDNLKRATILVDALIAAGATEALPVASPTIGFTLGELRHAFAQAREILTGFKALRAGQEIVWYPRSGIVELLLGSVSPSRAKEFVRRISPLIEHDKDKGTDLARTLETYLQHDCSVSSAAEALFIHPSTLKQRIKKAEKLLRVERLGQDFEAKVELYIALRINRLMLED